MLLIDPSFYFRCTNDKLIICFTKIMYLKNTNDKNNSRYNQTVKTVTLNITHIIVPCIRYNRLLLSKYYHPLTDCTALTTSITINNTSGYFK